MIVQFVLVFACLDFTGGVHIRPRSKLSLDGWRYTAEVYGRAKCNLVDADDDLYRHLIMQLVLYFVKVTGYLSLIKYSTSKKVCTRSSLFSITKWFSAWLKHFMDFLNNEHSDYGQHLVQGIQLQTWTTKNSKISPSEELLVTAIGVNTSWKPFSSGCHIVSCNIAFVKEYELF